MDFFRANDDFIHIGGFRMKGNSYSSQGVDHYGSYAKNVHLSNMIIEGVTDSAINVEKAWQGYVISNNTIVNCGKGITVHGVGVSVDGSVLTAEATKIGTKRVYHASAVESNLVVDCTDYAIKIGSGDTAAAWNPFSDAFASLGESSGNPVVPVRNNMVWNCGWNPTELSQDDAFSFQGDDWYKSDTEEARQQYGIITESVLMRDIEIGGIDTPIEWISDPLFLSVDPSSSDYLKLSNTSPARNLGNPYRIDIWNEDIGSDNPRIARRSIGAFPSENLSGDYVRINP